MDRRGVLKGLATVIGGIALNEAVPLGRVWSFPKEIKIADNSRLAIRYKNDCTISRAELTQRIDAFALSSDYLRRGDVLTVQSINIINPPTRFVVSEYNPKTGRIMAVPVEDFRNNDGA